MSQAMTKILPFRDHRGPVSSLILGRSAVPKPVRSIGFTSGETTAEPDVPSLVTYSGESHVVTFGSTGSGKTSGPAICNALAYEGQLIVFDCKGEVFEATARRRRELGQQVHVLDLRDDAVGGGSLNPLDLAVRCGGDTAVIARSFAAQFIERTGEEREPFWTNWAETMITGGIAWLLADRPASERNISRLFDLFNTDDVTYHIARMLDEKAVCERSAYAAFSGFLQLPEHETRPSVLASTQHHLRCWDAATIRRITSTTSFDIDALIEGEPMSLYIITPPYRLAAYRLLLRLWLTGLLFALMKRSHLPEHRTVMLCDEIGNMGYVEAFVTAATLMRGCGLQLWSFWQNPAQMEIYGAQARTIVDNAGVLQLLGANNRRMAQEFAQLVGGIEPDEIMAMARDEQIVLIDGGKPERLRRIQYFQEKMFAGQYDPIGRTRTQPVQRRLFLDASSLADKHSERKA